MPKRSTEGMIEHKICGIPCFIDVTHYFGGSPAILHGHPDNWAPEDPEEIEYDLYDRKGYKASWLEKKIEKDEKEQHAIIEKIRNARYDDYDGD